MLTLGELRELTADLPDSAAVIAMVPAGDDWSDWRPVSDIDCQIALLAGTVEIVVSEGRA